ncbi:MAG: hypothetical protein LBQ66_05930 [Planctomycetaceae bacterium]|nr:hypothetical protein [Planctomycetaceae bacterium]
MPVNEIKVSQKTKATTTKTVITAILVYSSESDICSHKQNHNCKHKHTTQYIGFSQLHNQQIYLILPPA